MVLSLLHIVSKYLINTLERRHVNDNKCNIYSHDTSVMPHKGIVEADEQVLVGQCTESCLPRNVVSLHYTNSLNT